MSAGQFILTFLVGAALALALGAPLGRRVRVTADWRRFIVMGGVCIVIGGGVAAAHHTVSAEFLIALALAWFGALLCGIALAEARRLAAQPPLPPAAPARAEPLVEEPRGKE